MAGSTAIDLDLFACAVLPRDELADIVSRLRGARVTVDAVEPTALTHNWGAISTAGVWRVDVHGHCDSGPVHQRFFVKLLRHPRLWPLLDLIPPGPPQEELIRRLPWRLELDLHRAGIAQLLPEGMRMPTLHAIREYDADHVAMWWEFVDAHQGAWEVADYARVAFLLGRLAARRRVGAAVNERLPAYCRNQESSALRYYTEHRVLLGMAPHLRSGAVWRHPILVEALAAMSDPELPADMVRLLDRLPGILTMLDRLPQTYCHGDASPQNFLLPVDRSEQLVLIDWGFATPLPVGVDLGQLLVGLANVQLCDIDALPKILEAIVAAYVSGLATEGYAEEASVVRLGVIGSLATRTALVALPFEMLERDPESQPADRWLNQLRLTRYLVDLAAELP